MPDVNTVITENGTEVYENGIYLYLDQYIEEHNVEDIKECQHIAPTTATYDMTCPFLDTGKSCEKCRIYPVRPEICKQFICNNEQRVKHNRKLLGQTRSIVDVREEFFGK